MIKDSTYKKYCLVIDEWFVNGFNGTKAYQSVYTESSSDSARTEFPKILAIPRVSEYKKKKQEEATEMLGTSHLEILNELKNWIYADITETIGLSASEVKKLPIEVRRLISSYKHTKKSIGENITEEIIELKFISKEKALEIITKHIGFFEKHNEQKTGIVLSDQERREKIEALRKKAQGK